jgi:hypothetical protein
LSERATITEFAIPLVTGQAACQPAEVAGRVRLPQAGRTDRGLTVMAVAGVAALSALGWLLCYTALRQPALAGGLTQWAATLWPLLVDLFIFVGTRGRSATAPTDCVCVDACGAVLGGAGGR